MQSLGEVLDPSFVNRPDEPVKGLSCMLVLGAFKRQWAGTEGRNE
jgi:hypothetical protein